MNDDEVLSFNQNETHTEACDPDSEAEARGEDSAVSRSEQLCDENDENSSVSDANLQDSHPDPAPDPTPVVTADAGTELADLRSELNALREELKQERAIRTRLSTEYEEFQVLYPDTPLSALSDGVWEDIRRGIPIAAAFALAEKRRHHKEALAEASNLSNALRSAGAMKPSESDYFSPDEVRAMSPDEVRKHYKQIRSSMKSWH